MNENLSPDTLVDASHVAAANGGGTVESPTLTLAELNKTLGADFKDPSTALKSLKDTKDFVGKRKEDIANELRAAVIPQNAPDAALKSDVQALRDDLFLAQNPQYKPHMELLKKINPNDLSEAAGDPLFKGLYEKAQVADEVTNNKSVVASNARLSQARSTTEQAVGIANARGTTQEDVALIFARSINDANNQG